MNLIDTIKEKLPMDDIHALMAQIQTNMYAKKVAKEDPVLTEVERILKRMHYLLSEQSSLNLGKQEIFTRDIKNDDETTRKATYSVDFTNPEHVKRLRTVLLELADLSSPDSPKAKHESIPGYLDYIAQSSI